MNVYQFTPSSVSNFQFSDTFDNTTCTIVVSWNIAGQRYYINMYDNSNALIVCMPLIGSPPTQNISMTAGYFSTQLVYRPDLGQFWVI